MLFHNVIITIADWIAKILVYIMTHIALCLLLFGAFLIIISIIAYLASHTKIFGFWWQLDNTLNKVANYTLLFAAVSFIFEIIILGHLVILGT